MELHKLTMKVLTGIREMAYACMQSSRISGGQGSMNK